MKCTMCDRELRKEVSEDGYQVDYICPVHGCVRGTISSITYRENKNLEILKALGTVFALLSFYHHFINSRFIISLFMLSWGILNQTGKLYEFFSQIDHFINRKEGP